MSPVILITALILYLALLFWIARIGDRQRFKRSGWTRHPLVYTLALGVYCTSWTFYGLVGTAAEHGWYYLPILLGPVLLFTFGYPLLQRIAHISRQENIHSIADFITSRYGKRQSIAVIVTLIMLATTVPYIALQLKAVTDTLLYSINTVAFAGQDLTLLVAFAMIFFTLIFGANRLDVASYHSGIMVAIAFESLIKLLALVAIAVFAFGLSEGFDFIQLNNSANTVFQQSTITPSFWVLTLVSAATIFCLPRMFQITFIECLSDKHLKFARYGFSLYLIVIAVAIFVISWIGNQVLANTNFASDAYVLVLPLVSGNHFLSLLAFIGGFSAATAMIIVASLTLSQMLSNDVILPLLIRKQKTHQIMPDYTRALMLTRRMTVVFIIAMAWLYQHSLAENVALTAIGLIAFALAVQLAPAIIFGLYWQRGNAIGVFAGLASGTVIWFITLMLPLLSNAGFVEQSLLTEGFFGLEFLRPEHLFGLNFSDSYTRGVVLSLAVNIITYLITSLQNKTHLSDRLQAITFVTKEQLPSSELSFQINKADLGVMLTHFLGESVTKRLLENEENSKRVQVNSKILRHAEQALAGIVGVASARALLSNLSSGTRLDVEDVVNIFEETTRSLQFSQDMLFASFESISSAISVVNADLKIVAWNKRYEQMFNYPEGMLCVGRLAADLVRYNAQRGILGAGGVEQQVQTRLEHLTASKPYRVVRNHNQSVIEIKGRPLPTGGYVTTYDDITEFINTQHELEQRVNERTKEITEINHSLREEVKKHAETEQELIKAKSIAERSNASKTQFLAIASHDIMQPLNAANLYASALLEKNDINPELAKNLMHLHNAIGSAEQIISSLLEISRLDTGSLKPNYKQLALRDIIEPLANEFRVQTNDNVTFHWQYTSLWTTSDAKYLRRILQNFISNAVKYTHTGKILIGCRRRNNQIEICVYDTGVGIAKANQKNIFDDFYRVKSKTEGIGLGLGIARRFAKLLGHTIQIQSTNGQGTVFSLLVPRSKQGTEQNGHNAHLSLLSQLENLSIFYVDDEENNIHALSTLMENWGCRFASATSVSSSVEYAKKHPAPNVVLMDYQLSSTTNGLTLAKTLQKLWGNVQICIVSAATDENLSIQANAAGFDFLRKPIKPGKLRALLERYLQQQSS